MTSEFQIRSSEEALFFGSMTILAILRKQIAQQKLSASKLTKLLKKTNISDAKLKTANEKLIEINKEVEALKLLMLEANCKPPLVHYRSQDWFAMNDEVVCFVGGELVPAKIHNNKGTYKDGTVALSVVYDRRVSTDGFLGGYGDIYATFDPQIVKKWEYEYFCRHFCFAKKWAMVAEEMDLRFNSFQFIIKIFAISYAKGHIKWK